MNAAKVSDLDYINFLIASPVTYSCSEAARVQPLALEVAHDALTRLLQRLEPDSEPLWREARQYVGQGGMLIVDDSTLDKPYAQKIGLVHMQWSGKHHKAVRGINLVTLLWSEGERAIPCDYRFYNKPNDGATKNEHFREMLEQAKVRGLQPKMVAFDSWYSSLDNLKAVRKQGWHWLTRLKSNRLVNPDGTGNCAVSEVDLSARGSVVHLKGYGMVKVFRIVAPNGDTEHWATSDTAMQLEERRHWASNVWTIETYHRGLKQFCGAEGSQVRSARGQRNHIGMSIRAFLRFEHHRVRTGTSWFEAKMGIIRSAVQLFLSHPQAISHGMEQSPASA